ncbi:MAG: enoyl-CoA hydratase/isomerase family protein, partial [Deltaproteobacteria bacterium]
MDYKDLLYDTAERLTTITINRPKSLNALNYETLEQLKNALTRAKNDPETKVILITGSGEKAFVAGADLNELALLNPMTGKEVSEKGQALLWFLENLGKPTIAVVNGFALGGGTELALACTMRVASPNAKFGLPEVGL